MVSIDLHTHKHACKTDPHLLLLSISSPFFYTPPNAPRPTPHTSTRTLYTPDKPIPFDFLVADRFVRTSLRKYCEQNDISEETTLNVRYVPALDKPEGAAENDHPDWVSCLDSGLASGHCVTGCYDGSIRVVAGPSSSSSSSSSDDNDDDVVSTTLAHEGAVKVRKARALALESQDQL